MLIVEKLSLVEDDQLPNRPFFYGNNYGSADSLLEALHSTPPPPPQRKRPSAIYKVADEESPLLGESGGDGVNPEDKARIVLVVCAGNPRSILIKFVGQSQSGSILLPMRCC